MFFMFVRSTNMKNMEKLAGKVVHTPKACHPLYRTTGLSTEGARTHLEKTC
jgi:hypothetical protein